MTIPLLQWWEKWFRYFPFSFKFNKYQSVVLTFPKLARSPPKSEKFPACVTKYSGLDSDVAWCIFLNFIEFSHLSLVGDLSDIINLWVSLTLPATVFVPHCWISSFRTPLGPAADVVIVGPFPSFPSFPSLPFPSLSHTYIYIKILYIVLWYKII